MIVYSCDFSHIEIKDESTIRYIKDEFTLIDYAFFFKSVDDSKLFANISQIKYLFCDIFNTNLKSEIYRSEFWKEVEW